MLCCSKYSCICCDLGILLFMNWRSSPCCDAIKIERLLLLLSNLFKSLRFCATVCSLAKSSFTVPSTSLSVENAVLRRCLTRSFFFCLSCWAF